MTLLKFGSEVKPECFEMIRPMAAPLKKGFKNTTLCSLRTTIGRINVCLK
jgi:hypothetical protein